MAVRARASVLFAAVCIISSLANSGELWEIVLRPKASDSSRLYVLHDCKNGGGTYQDGVLDPFPARQVSDMMLKTMGFLREGVNWPGVRLGNLFHRPRATALFLVDGLSAATGMVSLSERSFPVDQSELSGEVTADSMRMFAGDNVLQHFHRVFDGHSRVMAVSGDQEINSYLIPHSAEGPAESVSLDKIEGVPMGIFDASSAVDVQFLNEVALVQSQVGELSSSSAGDNSPDVYIFTFPSLEGLRKKYGAGSKQLEVAAELVASTIKMATDNLVRLYDEEILVQALVLQWEYIELSDQQQRSFEHLLHQHTIPAESVSEIMSNLPSVNLPFDMDEDTKTSLFHELHEMISATSEGSYVKGPEHRLRKRSIQERQDLGEGTQYGTPGGVVEDRSENFPAIFLIVFVTIVPMGLAVFAVSWAMWTMDPGRDSVIYRATDPAGMKMES